MATLIMIRHGESEANAEQRFTLHDDEPLTAMGHLQAQRTGRFLATEFEPVALYASPFLRTQQTAAGIGESFELETEVVPEIHEQSFGELKGRPYEEFYEHWSHESESDPLARWHHRAPGGESLADVAERVGPAVTRLARRHRGEQAIVVSHGGVMAALRAWIRGDFTLPPESTLNAGGYLLQRGDGVWRGPIALVIPDEG